MDSPYLDGENDRLRSTATDIHDVEIPMSEVQVLNKHFEKRKAFYKRQMLKDFEEVKDPVTGEKKAIMKFGTLQ